MSTTILDEIERINNIKRMENKKKLHSLLDKYGSLENFRQNSTMEEEFEYQFAQGDDIVDEVERERQAMMRAMNNLPKQHGSSKAVRELLKKNYTYMINYKVLPLLGSTLSGKVANFPITISGMLAASHKEGAPMTAKYLKSLEKIKMECIIFHMKNIKVIH